MASVNFDFEMFDDVRFDVLAEKFGFLSGDDARTKCGRAWRQCTLRKRHCLTPFELAKAMLQPNERAAELAAALVLAELADPAGDGTYYLRGTEGRVEWLEDAKASQKERAQLGGLARAKTAKRLPNGMFAPARRIQPPSSQTPATPAASASTSLRENSSRACENCGQCEELEPVEFDDGDYAAEGTAPP